MNPTSILALISDLYSQINALLEENAQLREALEANQESGRPESDQA